MKWNLFRNQGQWCPLDKVFWWPPSFFPWAPPCSLQQLFYSVFIRFSCSHAHLLHLGNSSSLVGITLFRPVVLNRSCTSESHGELLRTPAKQRNAHSLLAGVQYGAATLKNSSVVSYKTKHILPYDPANALVGIDPKSLKLTSTQKPV